jgi:DNA-binding Xre family transcriptional regulator
MSHQIIVRAGGERFVVVPEAEYGRLVEAAEMARDVALADESRRKFASGEDELLPIEMVERMLAGENLIRVWRTHRGMSVRALAEKAAIAQAYLSQIETGRRTGTIETMKRIADALNVMVDDLI